MAKVVIDAKEALDDIRAGMDDNSLMEKYNLTPEGLRKLFLKLEQAGVLKQLNAKEAIRDIRTGMSDEKLMRKHNLTDRQLQNLFKELDHTGLLRKGPAAPENPTIVIRVEDIANDIRRRIPKAEILDKYGLSDNGLRWIFKRLTETYVLARDEIYPHYFADGDADVSPDVRSLRRYTLDFDRLVYEYREHDNQGTIVDINERGIGICGLEAQVQEAKTLVVDGDEYGEFGKFTFDAICRWAKRSEDGKLSTGFEITDISRGNLAEMRLLIRLITFIEGRPAS